MTDAAADFAPVPGMRHDRHYTLEQAMAVRGWVAQRVGLGARRAGPADGHGLARRPTRSMRSTPSPAAPIPGREVARALVEISRAVGELEAVEIVLRDVDRGLIDFPAMRDGVEVYLCWLVDDEESIGFWHEPEAGFAGRRPL